MSGVSISVENGIHIIRLNNPKKKNALGAKTYIAIKEAFQDAAENKNVLITVLTGTGDFYSSGFDLTDADLIGENEKGCDLLKDMIAAMIDYPKLLVAVVNGPAIGLAVTTLGLCDIVYASDKATFQTPFSKLGLCVEGCASYTFPRIFGKSKANEMLYVGHKMPAEEAHRYGFVSEVFKHSEIHKIWEKIQEFKEVSQTSILLSKKMVNHFQKDKLHEANIMEIKNIHELTASEEFINNIMKFMTRKSKL